MLSTDVLNSQNLIPGQRLLKNPESHSRDEFGRKMGLHKIMDDPVGIQSKQRCCVRDIFFLLLAIVVPDLTSIAFNLKPYVHDKKMREVWKSSILS